jgi:hypothetical protein
MRRKEWVTMIITTVFRSSCVCSVVEFWMFREKIAALQFDNWISYIYIWFVYATSTSTTPLST